MEIAEINWRTPLATFIAGCCLGGLIGAVKGGTLAASRDRNNTVSRDEYNIACDEIDKFVALYHAERERNVRMTGQHSVAKMLIRKRAHPTQSASQ